MSHLEQISSILIYRAVRSNVFPDCNQTDLCTVIMSYLAFSSVRFLSAMEIDLMAIQLRFMPSIEGHMPVTSIYSLYKFDVILTVHRR